jgi:hypothetical protein
MTKRIRVQSVLGAAALAFVLQACSGGNDPSNSGTGTGGSGTQGGTAGTTGQAGTSGQAGTTGNGGSTSTGSGGSFVSTPSCTGLTTAAAAEPTKGGACVAADPQLCFKTCGPEKAGVKSETCTGGVYAEMSGCSFDPAMSFACYKIPAAANTLCPAGTPQASTDCTVDHCVICNSTGGLPGGGYSDSGGAAKVGYCVCQQANSTGKRTWSCASDTAWPCPAGAGC